MSKRKPDDVPPDPVPRVAERGQQSAAARREREAAALRENLAKRKAQQRSRRLCGPEKA